MSEGRPRKLSECTALEDPGPYTVANLAEKLPDFTPEAIAAALDQLADAGVLAREAGPNGEPTYRYVAPERYRFANVPVVKAPGPDFGKRG
ncbi:MAG: hypothetical protein HY320_13985 [Armatimonadetes bacterium]|nr:hypothetical protein [Armatimonadota bacterium]